MGRKRVVSESRVGERCSKERLMSYIDYTERRYRDAFAMIIGGRDKYPRVSIEWLTVLTVCKF